MKIKKTISEKVIKASQENGKKGKGPNNKNAVTQNARTHGLLSKRLVFRTEEEQQEFAELLDDLMDQYMPIDRTTREAVHEVAVCIWKKAQSNGWELQELAHRSEAPAAILKALAENDDAGQLPLFNQRNGSHSTAQLGWDCEGLVVRTGTSKSVQDDSSLSDRKDKSGHVLIEARLSTSLDTVLRYQAAAKRDLRDAIKLLESLLPEPEKSAKSLRNNRGQRSGRRRRRES